MFNDFRNVLYLPILKWKLGEYRALGTIRGASKERLVPVMVMLPAGEFDHETGRRLDPTEHIRAFGPRLHTHWGKRIAFVDGILLDNEKHAKGLSTHPLTELLEKGRLAGALACPVTAIGRSEGYQSAVKRFVQNNSPLPICIRVSALELESLSFKDDIRVLMARLSCEPLRAILILDFGAPDLREYVSFAELLVDRINELPSLHEWLGVATATTSFPETIMLKAGQSCGYPRNDWSMYVQLVEMRERLLRMPMFSDYAVEYPAYRETKRVTPTAHLRYSTDKAYVVEKGSSVRKPNGYEAIYPVSKALTMRKEFKGSTFSEGDAFIEQLAQRSPGGPGNAATWRWAATDHHLTLVTKSLGPLIGIPEADKQVIDAPVNQMSLFSDSTPKR